MALPGTPGQRISDLCNGNHITQKELAEKIGVSASQLSRIVSGETRTVSIIRKSKFPWFPERSVQFSGKRTKRSVQKKGCTQHL
ncbi:helix-turn-helix domain-containing protein [Phocaeicola vulgatus]|uniref:helix-turn-helix domain-containing protein n=1 Tax=Phocaeicola vulgatus TaxID=821 RepID=UPI002090080F|nr:helix-turn-helix transcriptional regulator [Phocaeicola vulgatus]